MQQQQDTLNKTQAEFETGFSKNKRRARV